MNHEDGKITVYYDGACPVCIRDRNNYERLSGNSNQDVCWFDITGKDDELRILGIDPRKALTELHVCDEQQKIHTELDAYILLMGKTPILKPLGVFIGLPVIRPWLSCLYHWKVNRRLMREGRL